MDINNYIMPELLVLVPVLYMVGIAIKKSNIKDCLIPATLGTIGIALAGLWIFANTLIADSQQVAMALFSAITQGIIIAGVAVYGNQIVKQFNKEEI